MYNIDSLESGIANCKVSIKSLEEAADKERETIKEYRKMIDDLEQAERVNIKIEKAKTNIEIVRD